MHGKSRRESRPKQCVTQSRAATMIASRLTSALIIIVQALSVLAACSRDLFATTQTNTDHYHRLLADT